jgi:hypothetical protein
MEVPMKLASSLLVLGAISFAAMSALADMGKDAAPLKAAAGSKAESHIAAGIEHYGKGHWDVAKKHFSEAEKADPSLLKRTTILRWPSINLAITKARPNIFSAPLRSERIIQIFSSRRFSRSI